LFKERLEKKKLDMELLKKQEISLSQVKEFVKITIDEKELDNRRAEKEKVIGNELLIHY